MLAALAAAASACKDERPIRMGEARPTRRVETRDIVVEAKDAVADASAEPEVDVAPGDAPPGEPDEVTADACRAACQNALRLTLAELPDAASVRMREEITRTLEADCPTRCVAKGSVASVRCIAAAKTALELAACPR